jgi:hypothetical protein
VSYTVSNFPIWDGDNFHFVNEFLEGKRFCNKCKVEDIEIKKMHMTPIDKKRGYFWIWYEFDDELHSSP